MASPRTICFATGTRAEFGLMRTTLAAIRDHPDLKLSIVATGMHLDPSRGRTLDAIVADGWTVDRVVDWPPGGDADADLTARHTGAAMAGLASAFAELAADVVLVVGDRVEAFAAAAAGQVAGRVVAHVHGGDRAQGQVDDSLRHAITKLAHVHLAATEKSASRIRRMGEQAWRIHTVGAPGIDGIREQAATIEEVRAAGIDVTPGRFALTCYHPTSADERAESRRAFDVLGGVDNAMAFSGPTRVPIPRLTSELPADAVVRQQVIVYPNNDPGSAGIVAHYDKSLPPPAPMSQPGRRYFFVRSADRRTFLGLMRDAAVMVGNSSAGVIEAASFGTPVVDVGDRQKGRERSANVVGCRYTGSSVKRAALAALKAGRFDGPNVYGGDGAGRRIAEVLAGLTLDERLRRKLIAY